MMQTAPPLVASFSPPPSLTPDAHHYGGNAPPTTKMPMGNPETKDYDGDM